MSTSIVTVESKKDIASYAPGVFAFVRQYRIELDNRSTSNTVMLRCIASLPVHVLDMSFSRKIPRKYRNSGKTLKKPYKTALVKIDPNKKARCSLRRLTV